MQGAPASDILEHQHRAARRWNTSTACWRRRRTVHETLPFAAGLARGLRTFASAGWPALATAAPCWAPFQPLDNPRFGGRGEDDPTLWTVFVKRGPRCPCLKPGTATICSRRSVLLTTGLVALDRRIRRSPLGPTRSCALAVAGHVLGRSLLRGEENRIGFGRANGSTGSAASFWKRRARLTAACPRFGNALTAILVQRPDLSEVEERRYSSLHKFLANCTRCAQTASLP